MGRIGILSFVLLAVVLIKIEAQVEKEWWKHATFYQIYPRSFMDTNGNGKGDLRGIISKMDHLKEIGMDACWLSPIFASPQVDTGYDVSDFYTIEPDYGTMAEFDELMAKANELGIRLMLDFIPNHTSDQHQWFIESATGNPGIYKDFYVWHDGTPNVENPDRPFLPNNWVSVFGGPAWTWHEGRKAYYLHQFSAQQPDLNYRNPAVVDAMKDVMYFYMEKGVSGFRLDAINHMFEDPALRNEPENPDVTDQNDYEHLLHIYTKDLQETFDLVYEWRTYLDDYVREKNLPYDIILMTEAYASTYDTMRYYRDPNDGRIGAHMPFNFQLIFNFYADAKAENIKNGIFEWLDNMPEGKTADWVAGSHDHSRVASRVGVNKVHMVNTVVLTLPGASVTYYGEEIGMEDHKGFEVTDGRDPNRTPMQWDGTTSGGFSTNVDTWLPVHPNYETLNVAAQKGIAGSTYEYFKKVSELRKNTVFRQGAFHLEVINENVLAYSRKFEGEGYMVVINVDSTAQSVDLSVLDIVINGDLTVTAAAPNSAFVEGAKLKSNAVTLSPYDAVIFLMEAEVRVTDAPSTQVPSTITAETTTAGAANVILGMALILASFLTAVIA